MKTQEKKKRTTDEVIAYLLQSKRELQDEIKNDANSEEFKAALAKLRELNAGG
jgi:hypothetical protein